MSSRSRPENQNGNSGESFGHIRCGNKFMNAHQFRGVARRDLLRAIAAASGAAMMSPFSELLAQALKGRKRRIDVHHHMLPPFQPNMTSWHYTPQVSLDEMDKFGTESAILSLTIAAEYLYDGTDKAIKFARESNEYGAKAVQMNSKRFGFFRPRRNEFAIRAGRREIAGLRRLVLCPPEAPRLFQPRRERLKCSSMNFSRPSRSCNSRIGVVPP